MDCRVKPGNDTAVYLSARACRLFGERDRNCFRHHRIARIAAA